ncbi:segregation/condensation protein A [Streptomyces sp. NBC_01102]|uniref:segregation and condensation protein A n=1 Tax=Streptomyces sp. NBC_01102 TaxID=2903749 RepID=UPI0038657C18|nr:segregation/condensation protein A [Streptomyces sp. NBC_01102]
MPTADHPARPPRRALGRGPGARTGAGPGEAAPGGPPSGDRLPDPVDVPTGAADAPQRAERAPEVPEGDRAAPVPAEGGAGPSAAVGEDGTGLAEPAEGDTGSQAAAEGDTGPPAPAGNTGSPEAAEDGTGSPEAVDDKRFTVRLVNFEGPFDLLLQLISKHKLDVTEVALSRVTDEFMAHIRAMGPDWDLDQTTEFLVVAATLLDLKAARLLPTAEVEDEADLALLEARDLLFARLLQYRAYKRIAEILSDRLESESRRYPRTVGLEPQHAELLPEVVISIGPDGFARLAVKAMQPRAEPQVYVDHIHAPLVSVREQAGIVVGRLRAEGELSFRVLTEDAGDTLTVVARFLALLELYREKAVTLDQEEALGELLVRWAGAEGADPVVTDEFDQEEQEDVRE